MPLQSDIPVLSPAGSPPVGPKVPAPRAPVDGVVEVVAALVTVTAGVREVTGAGLLECFAALPDPRDRRGRRHSLSSILGLCTAAVLAGEVDLVGITAWVAAAPQPLLAAATHTDSVVVAERAIGPKSTEVPQFQPLLRGLAQVSDLTGWVITADAGHTVRAHARFIRVRLFEGCVIAGRFGQAVRSRSGMLAGS